MANWDRTPPVCGMSIEEIKRRVADGIKNRQQTGEVLPERKALPGQDKGFMLHGHGPRMTKAQRIVAIQSANLCIAALCQNDGIDYCHAAETLNAVRKQAGLKKNFMHYMLKGAAQQAAEITGESFEVLDNLARRWLAEYFAPSGKVISIAKKGETHGNQQDPKKASSSPAPGPGKQPKPDD